MRKFLLVALSCTLWTSVVRADNLNQILAYSYENNLTLLADREGQKITDEEVSLDDDLIVIVELKFIKKLKSCIVARSRCCASHYLYIPLQPQKCP